MSPCSNISSDEGWRKVISTVVTAGGPSVSQTMAATLGLIALLAISELAYVTEGDAPRILRRNLLVFAMPLLTAFFFTVVMVFLGFIT